MKPDVFSRQSNPVRLKDWLLFPYLWLRYGSPIKPDETVVLFPTSASMVHSDIKDDPPGERRWHVPIHAWVVEKEEGAITRTAGKHSLLSLLGLSGVIHRRNSTRVFERRLSWFMADREANKRIRVSIGDDEYLSPRSGMDGHIEFSVDYAGDAPDGSVLNYVLTDLPASHHPIEGGVQLVPKSGLSVISDIDDTIKISEVTDKRSLVRGLFFDQYHTAPGMPEFYQHLASSGACFHYVSSSPWQLYPSIAPFLSKYFPFGCLSQRHFYIGNQSFIRFFRSSMEYKFETIGKLFERYPKRRFILIGDSGEKDPEVYTRIANHYPEQVSLILIREVYSNEQLQTIQHQMRWTELRSALDCHQKLCVFHTPEELGGVDTLLSQANVE